MLHPPDRLPTKVVMTLNLDLLTLIHVFLTLPLAGWSVFQNKKISFLPMKLRSKFSYLSAETVMEPKELWAGALKAAGCTMHLVVEC